MVLATVLMLGVVAFAPSAPTSYDEAAKPRRTPTPRPTTTPASTTLTAPGLLTPENGATAHTGPLTFSWAPVPGAAHYHIQAGGIIERWGLTDPSYTFNVTPGFVTYYPRLYWRVQAMDANYVEGPWSEWHVIYLVNP
jgi:hypothetical protein